LKQTSGRKAACFACGLNGNATLYFMDPSLSIETEARPRSALAEILKFTLIALMIVTPFRFFVAQPFIVSGASMVPTFDPKEYLVIDELTYRFEKPSRGDVLIFRYPLDSAVFYIKRVVGLPGETIEIKGGSVFITDREGNTRELSEPYLSTRTPLKDESVTRLTDSEYFVMGDNRVASSDSREWGPLNEKFIVGRAVARLFPISEADILPGEYRQP